jgi:hypothetical protein
MRRFSVPPDTQVEGPRRLILQLLLPGINLVGMLSPPAQRLAEDSPELGW